MIMGSERNTLVGTPLVLAPGSIVLLGEHGLTNTNNNDDHGNHEPGWEVVAAVTRHAKAQFVPRADAMSDLVAEVVKRIQNEVGEALGALPAGSVSLDSEGFRDQAGLAEDAATAVATAAAVLEALGLPIEGRKAQIVDLALGACQAVAGRTRDAAGVLAATYGGLVKLVRAEGAAPAPQPLVPPAGLHLVLFGAAPLMPPAQIIEGLKRYAVANPDASEASHRALDGFVRRFVDEVSAGCATGAVWAAGQYATELASLTAAAEVPIVTGDFKVMADLAHELGGAAKPTEAAEGKLGVAIFANQEAAERFRMACPTGVSLMAGDLEASGVHCQEPQSGQAAPKPAHEAPNRKGSFPIPIPKIESVYRPPTTEAPTVRISMKDLESVSRPVSIRPPEPGPKTESKPEPALEPQPRSSGRRGLRRQGALIAAVAAAVAVVTWIAVPHRARARFQDRAPTSGATLGHAPPASAQPSPAAPAPAPSPPPPASAPDEAKKPRGAEAVPADPPAAAKPGEASAARAAKHPAQPPVPRAGRLSAVDF
jgi:hypothetical protein